MQAYVIWQAIDDEHLCSQLAAVQQAVLGSLLLKSN